MTKVLVLDAYRHSLNILRDLKHGGFDTILGIDVDCSEIANQSQKSKPIKLGLLENNSKARANFSHLENHFVFYSNTINQFWTHESIEKTDVFVQQLNSLLESDSDIKVIYPVGEVSTYQLAKIKDLLPSHVKIIAPNLDLLHFCLSKLESNKVCESLNIPVAKFIQVKSIHQIEQSIQSIGYPFILKPTEPTIEGSIFKCEVIDNEQTLKSKLNKLPAAFNLLMQQQAFGKRHNCQFLAKHGKIKVYFESKVLKTTEADDTGYSTWDVSVNPFHQQHCSKLVEHLNYDGIGCIQFLYNERDQTSTFLEFNPRTDATIALAIASGVSFPALVVKQALNINLPTNSKVATYAVNRYRHWLDGDLQRLSSTLTSQQRFSIKLSAILKVLTRVFYANQHTVFNLYDLKPAFVCYFGKISNWLRNRLN